MRALNSGVAAIAIVISLTASGAYAQAADGPAAGQQADQEAAKAQSGDHDSDIVVTAEKSGARRLQKVPLAIQAFDGAELKQRNINTVDDLVSAVPGAFEGQRQSVASRSYNLRGAGGSNANGDSPIGYYVDDVPFIVTNFGIAPPIRFQDLERVEVLRGPQGTLYGQGSSGGVFVFHTRDPNLKDIEFAGEASVGQTRGADGVNTGFAAAISVPIVKDKLAIRISGGHSFNPGWADVYYGPYDGTPDRTGVNKVRNDDIRVVALFKPTDNFSVRAQYWHFRPRQEFLGGMASVDPAYYQNTAGQPSFGNGDFKLYSLSAALDLGSVAITSATSYLKGNFGIYIPISPSGFFSSQFYPKMFAQEVRANSTGAGPLHWVIGAQYQDGQGPQKNQLLNPAISINADNNTITKNGAVFGELSYDLFGGKVVPLVGLRYYHDKRTFEDATSSLPSTKNVTTWRLNLSYLPNDDLTMFITAATGFRAGIVQSTAQVASLQLAGVPASTQLKPETSTNYEIGVKWRSVDRNLSVGLNGYITKYKDMQTNTPGGIAGVNGFSNFGDATTKGIDFEVHWRTPLAGLRLNAVGNVNDGKYDRVNPAVQLALPLFRPGSRIVNSIEYNYRLDASYNRDLGGDVALFGNFAWSRNGNRLQSAGLIADPYSQLSTTFGLRYKAYELALIGDNLADERGPTIIGTQGPLSGSGPNPRTVSLRFRVNFQ
jgi:outer membrane receptor protein involved in Fe transport